MSAPGRVTHRGALYPRDLDHMGHVNVTTYMAHFDQATWSFFADLGFTPTWFRDSGCGLSAVRYDIQFKKELLAGDVITVRSRFTRVGTSSFSYVHEMTNSETGEVVATAEVTGVHIDYKARRAVPLPPEMAARLRVQVSATAETPEERR